VKYTNPTDKRLVAELKAISGKHGEYQPVKVWSPTGIYWVSTAATHEDLAGSMVADKVMPEDEYWPTVVSGYQSVIRSHNATAQARMNAEYRAGWIGRVMQYLEERA